MFGKHHEVATTRLVIQVLLLLNFADESQHLEDDSQTFQQIMCSSPNLSLYDILSFPRHSQALNATIYAVNFQPEVTNADVKGNLMTTEMY
jgi:hypothetical protein